MTQNKYFSKITLLYFLDRPFWANPRMHVDLGPIYGTFESVVKIVQNLPGGGFEGVTQYKKLCGNVQTWEAKSASWYINDLL